MRIKIKNIITGYAAFLLLFASCDSSNSNMGVIEERPNEGPIVYLAVTRAQQEGVDSFNADATDFEDRVHDLAMLVFDSSTGEKVCEYYDENIPFDHKEKTFTVKMMPGQRDFYFVANMPMAPLKAITNRSAMQTYMQQMNVLDEALYSKAATDKGFPMSRVYNNQMVTEGGTIMNPRPFLPEGTDSKVKLIRVVAKIEINLSGVTDNLKSISYCHARTQFLLGSTTKTPESAHKPQTLLTEISSRKYIYYIPEVIISDPALVWNQETPNTPVNYFIVETKSGKKFNVPILSNGDEAQTSYLKFARGEEETTNPKKPEYSVVRNQHYKMAVTMPKEDFIAVKAEVLPWIIREQGVDL